MAAQIIFGSGFEASTATLLARVTGVDGEPIVQASLTTLSYEVWEIPVPLEYKNRDWQSLYLNPTIPTKIVSAVSLTIADVVFDTLQLDDRWADLDAIGYNLAVPLPDTTFPLGDLEDYPKGIWNEIPFKAVPAVGPSFRFSFKMLAKANNFGKTP